MPVLECKHLHKEKHLPQASIAGRVLLGFALARDRLPLDVTLISDAPLLPDDYHRLFSTDSPLLKKTLVYSTALLILRRWLALYRTNA